MDPNLEPPGPASSLCNLDPLGGFQVLFSEGLLVLGSIPKAQISDKAETSVTPNSLGDLGGTSSLGLLHHQGTPAALWEVGSLSWWGGNCGRGPQLGRARGGPPAGHRGPAGAGRGRRGEGEGGRSLTGGAGVGALLPLPPSFSFFLSPLLALFLCLGSWPRGRS